MAAAALARKSLIVAVPDMTHSPYEAIGRVTDFAASLIVRLAADNLGYAYLSDGEVGASAPDTIKVGCKFETVGVDPDTDTARSQRVDPASGIDAGLAD